MVQHLGADPATTEEEHLRLTLVQVDMERLKFLVRSYVRVRLQKVLSFFARDSTTLISGMTLLP